MQPDDGVAGRKQTAVTAVFLVCVRARQGCMRVRESVGALAVFRASAVKSEKSKTLETLVLPVCFLLKRRLLLFGKTMQKDHLISSSSSNERIRFRIFLFLYCNLVKIQKF